MVSSLHTVSYLGTCELYMCKLYTSEVCTCEPDGTSAKFSNLWVVAVVGCDDPSIGGLNLRAYGLNECDAVLYAQGGQGDGVQLLALVLQLKLETCRTGMMQGTIRE